MKSLSAFFMLTGLLMLPSSNWTPVERDKLNYEVTQVSFTDTHLELSGWAVIPITQHFNSNQTHSYELDVIGKNHQLFIQGNLVNTDVTSMFAYNGYKTCDSTLNSMSCNYQFTKAGFKFSVPLKDLREGEEYTLYLKTHAKLANKRYRIPMFFVQKGELVKTIGQTQYYLESDYSHIQFQVYSHTLYARTGPTPTSTPIKIGNSCSTTYQNTGYMRQGAVFQNILDIQKYQNLYTYFKVQVEPSGCVNNRQRMVESVNSNHFVYVPSTLITYIGNPSKLYVRRLTSIPILKTEDIEMMQYDTYEPLKYASASDTYDGNIDRNIKVVNSNVNTSIPGHYQTCYEVFNSSSKKAHGCASITVIRKPTRPRFISKYTVHNTKLIRWNRNRLRNVFKESISLESGSYQK